MKRSNTSLAATPNRRSLIQHRHALLNDPEVVAFLDNTATPVYETLADKLLRANEPALLLELVWVAQRGSVNLQVLDDHGDVLLLHDGLFDHVLQHIDEVPCMHELTVAEAVLSAATCALLQTVLSDATCSLDSLAFTNCSFADAQVQFPTSSVTIEDFNWNDELHGRGGPSAMDQMLPSLAGWARLSRLTLVREEHPLNFGVISQLLLHNPRITTLCLAAEVAPVAPNNPGHQPQQDPELLLDPLAVDKIALRELYFEVRDANDIGFNEHCLELLTRCLMSNTTLELLEVPGIRMCTRPTRERFLTGLNTNRGLISLAPLYAFNNQVPAPVRRNQSQRYWFSREFVLGAAEAFLQLIALPKDLDQRLAGHLAPTAVERIYCAPLMALICKSTHQNAVKLRSAGLRAALLIYIRTNDKQRCQVLLRALVQSRLDLLPEDKQLVIACAKEHNRLDFLPANCAN